MSEKRRIFNRNFGTASYRKLFIISCEGSVTEPQYFSSLNQHVHIEPLYAKGNSAPSHVLKRMKDAIDKISIRDGSEAWLVIDKDRWPDDQIKHLFEWTSSKEKVFKGLAVSNPKFELWVLLHFEDVIKPNNCSNRLGKYMPGYNKSLDNKKIGLPMIKCAIERAEKLDSPQCRDWPKKTGTTVYRLVKNILNSCP